MHNAGPDPETKGHHRRVEARPAVTPGAPTDNGRHRALAAPNAELARPRRRHAADEAPRHHPDARRSRRAPQRVAAAAALLAVALAPVLARSSSALGLHDAVAAELAAHPGQADEAREALGRGGQLASPVRRSSGASSTTAPEAVGDLGRTPGGRMASTTAPGTGGSPADGSATAEAVSSSVGRTPGSAPSRTTSTDSTPTTTTPTDPPPTGSTPTDTRATDTTETATPVGTPTGTVLADDPALPLPLPTGAGGPTDSVPTDSAPTASAPTASAPVPPTTSAPETTETTTPAPTEDPGATQGAAEELIDRIGDLLPGG